MFAAPREPCYPNVMKWRLNILALGSLTAWSLISSALGGPNQNTYEGGIVPPQFATSRTLQPSFAGTVIARPAFATPRFETNVRATNSFATNQWVAAEIQKPVFADDVVRRAPTPPPQPEVVQQGYFKPTLTFKKVKPGGH